MRFLPRLLADMAGRENSDADLKQKLEIRTQELNEVQEQQTVTSRKLSESLEREKATSEVLGIISGLPTDLEPVFEAILANATRLCEASHATLLASMRSTVRCQRPTRRSGGLLALWPGRLVLLAVCESGPDRRPHGCRPKISSAGVGLRLGGSAGSIEKIGGLPR
jgi:hypothetical protein